MHAVLFVSVLGEVQQRVHANPTKARRLVRCSRYTWLRSCCPKCDRTFCRRSTSAKTDELNLPSSHGQLIAVAFCASRRVLKAQDQTGDGADDVAQNRSRQEMKEASCTQSLFSGASMPRQPWRKPSFYPFYSFPLPLPLFNGDQAVSPQVIFLKLKILAVKF